MCQPTCKPLIWYYGMKFAARLPLNKAPQANKNACLFLTLVEVFLGIEVDVEVDKDGIHHFCNFSSSRAGALGTELHQPSCIAKVTSCYASSGLIDTYLLKLSTISFGSTVLQNCVKHVIRAVTYFGMHTHSD